MSFAPCPPAPLTDSTFLISTPEDLKTYASSFYLGNLTGRNFHIRVEAGTMEELTFMGLERLMVPISIGLYSASASKN
jgi:hypothetical protein